MTKAKYIVFLEKLKIKQKFIKINKQVKFL